MLPVTCTLHILNACILCLAKKDAKRLAKEAKFAAKSAAKATTTAPGEAKAKVAKPKKEEEAPFVNTTPKGEKKGSYNKLLVSSYRLTQYFRSHPTFICLWLQSKRLGTTGGKSKASSNHNLALMAKSNLSYSPYPSQCHQ